MLTADTKRHIDSARQVLVGQLPNPMSQIQEITNALIYKFMDDMDEQSATLGGKRKYFTGKYAKYGWREIMSPKIGAQERLNLYQEALRKMQNNPGLPPMFQKIFQNAYLPFNDPRTLTLFLKEIDYFDYKHSEELGNAYEYLLSIMGSQGDAGQFRTPRHIIDFIVKVLDPGKDDKILDPACGSAGFLISSFKHIMAQHDGKDNISGEYTNKEVVLTADEKKKLYDNFKGYDIDNGMVKLSQVNMFLHGFINPKIIAHDTLSSEDYWQDRYDVILANPPFMTPKGGIVPHNKFSVTSNRAEVLFVDYIMNHLKPSGRAGIIVPEGVIFQSGTAYKQLRKNLVEDGLYCVVSLPSGVFNPYAGVKTSILLLDNEVAKTKKEVLFVKITKDGYDLGAQRRRLSNKDGVEPEWDPTVSDLPDAIDSIKAFENGSELNMANAQVVEKQNLAEDVNYNLNGDRYKNDQIREDYEYDLVELGALVDIVGGSTPLKSNEEFWSGGTIPWFTVDDIRKNGRLITTTQQHITKIALEKTSIRLVPSESVLLCCTASVGEYAFTQIELTTNQQFNALIVKDRTNLIPAFLYWAVSNFKEKLERMAGKTSFNFVSAGTLKKIKIPLPPIEVQKEIVAELDGYQKIIDAAQTIVKTYKPTIKINPEWPNEKIGTLAELMTGGTPSRSNKEYWDNGTIPWLVSGDIHKGVIIECDGRITENALKNSNARILPKDSVMIALNGQGKTRATVALLKKEGFTCNQSLVAIKPHPERLRADFLYYQMKSMYKQIRDINGDNQRGGLNMPIIRSIEVYVPPISEQSSIVEELHSENEIINNNKKLIEIYQKKIKEKISELWGV